MKYKFGKYITWYGPYQLFGWMERFIGEDRFEKVVDATHPFLTWVHDKRKQNVKVKIEQHDIWCFGSSLAPVILPMLKEYKEVMIGHPLTTNDDIPEDLHNDDDMVRWGNVIDEMIFAFEVYTINTNWEEEFYPKDSDGELDFDNGEIDWDGRKAVAVRIQRGFELFGKYFQNLWD